jgi:hypothetical protein
MHDPNTRNDQSKTEQPALRVFHDADGQRWQVFERAFDTFDRRSGASLIFVSEVAMRRVRNYPANWMELSDDALASLSWGL